MQTSCLGNNQETGRYFLSPVPLPAISRYQTRFAAIVEQAIRNLSVSQPSLLLLDVGSEGVVCEYGSVLATASWSGWCASVQGQLVGDSVGETLSDARL